MNLNLDQHIIDALDELARRDRRSRSMMANLLLEVALEVDAARGGRPSPLGTVADADASAVRAWMKP